MLSALISSELSYPAMQLALQPVHQRFVHSGPLVLGAAPVKLPTPTADRDQTVSRRFKPSSRTTLNGEQPYPWDRLQPQDVMSRHRGAKLRRRYELLGGISLLSPEYLLSVERWPFHTEPPDHYVLLSHLLDLSISQLSTLLPLHFRHDNGKGVESIPLSTEEALKLSELSKLGKVDLKNFGINIEDLMKYEYIMQQGFRAAL